LDAVKRRPIDMRPSLNLTDSGKPSDYSTDSIVSTTKPRVGLAVVSETVPKSPFIVRREMLARSMPTSQVEKSNTAQAQEITLKASEPPAPMPKLTLVENRSTLATQSADGSPAESAQSSLLNTITGPTSKQFASSPRRILQDTNGPARQVAQKPMTSRVAATSIVGKSGASTKSTKDPDCNVQ
jgi:hypothetical protein